MSDSSTSDSALKSRIGDAMKAAMKARDKERLGTIRLIQSEMKRIEVDERITLDDARVLAILERMRKQRKDSITQYESAGRQELADVEAKEIAVIEEFLPAPLSEAEVTALIDQAIADTGANSMRAMGQVMAQIKPQIQGRADAAQVSALVKARLQ